MKLKALTAGGLLTALAVVYGAPSMEYLRTSTELRSGKSTSATAITSLDRGTPVSVLKKAGSWRQVRVTRLGVEGWLHRSRLTRIQPKGGSDDRQAVADARATRLSVGASIRGLKPEAEGYANAKSIGPQQRQWVNTMIAYRVDPASLDRFMRVGKLGEYSEGE